MRWSLIVLAVVFTVNGSSWCFADDVSRRKTAEELLMQLQTDKNMEKAMSQVMQMQSNVLKTMGAPEDAIDNELSGKVFDLMKRELSWSRMKDSYIDAYAEVFTENEMKDMINFYKTPSGVKFIEQMPILMQKGMEISQASLQRMMPELKKMIDESMKKKENRPSDLK